VRRGAIGTLRQHGRDPLFRHSYLLLASAGISAASGFVFWIIAARLSSAEAVGRSAALVSAVALLSYLTSLGLPYGMLRFGSADRDLSSAVNVAVLLTVASSVAASLIFVAGVRLWTPALAGLVQPPPRLTVFVVVNVGAALVVMLDNLFAARRAAQIPLVRSALTAVGKLGLLPAVAGLGAIGIYLAALAPAAAIVLLILVCLPWLVPAYQVRALRYRGSASELVSYSISTYPAALLAGAPPFFIPLIALTIVGSRQTAYFYVAWNLLAILLLIPSIISNMSLSEGSRDLPWRTADRARKFAIALIVPLTVGLMLVGRPMLSLFGHAYAAHGTWPLRIFAVSLIPWTFLNINQAALRADARHRELTLVSMAFAVLTLVGPTVFGLAWGLTGLAAGWTLGVSIASAGLALLAGRHRRRERAPSPLAPPAPDTPLDWGPMSADTLL
jgi:O-antigen/teichoic acid export membrane protein